MGGEGLPSMLLSKKLVQENLGMSFLAVLRGRRGLHPLDHSGTQWSLIDKSQMDAILRSSSFTRWTAVTDSGLLPNYSCPFISARDRESSVGVLLELSFCSTSPMPFIFILSYRPSPQC